MIKFYKINTSDKIKQCLKSTENTRGLHIYRVESLMAYFTFN